MRNEDRPTAFIAMRFGDDHWRDKTYLVIREEIEAAGYRVLRGDELKTSGPVVDEVCRLLREADFVVIDSSGDSHSVSYELGYCHGAGRSPASTLLLRDDNDLPFNYRHFRHRVYNDIRHLRRLLRDYLSISEPLSDDMFGYSFTFAFSETAQFGYIVDGAECVLDALLATGLSGRCEIYSAEQFSLPGRHFTVGVAVRVTRRRRQSSTPDYDFWKRLVDHVDRLTSRFDGRITLDRQLSEMGSKRAMKTSLLYCGAAELLGGHVIRVLDAKEEDNFIESYLRRKGRSAS